MGYETFMAVKAMFNVVTPCDHASKEYAASMQAAGSSETLITS
jgi:hypothetical protein